MKILWFLPWHQFIEKSVYLYYNPYLLDFQYLTYHEDIYLQLFSNYIFVAIFSIMDKNNRIWSIVFHFWTFTSAKLNYNIYNRL